MRHAGRRRRVPGHNDAAVAGPAVGDDRVRRGAGPERGAGTTAATAAATGSAGAAAVATGQPAAAATAGARTGPGRLTGAADAGRPVLRHRTGPAGPAARPVSVRPGPVARVARAVDGRAAIPALAAVVARHGGAAATTAAAAARDQQRRARAVGHRRGAAAAAARGAVEVVVVDRAGGTAAAGGRARGGPGARGLAEAVVAAAADVERQRLAGDDGDVEVDPRAEPAGRLIDPGARAAGAAAPAPRGQVELVDVRRDGEALGGGVAPPEGL